jgi:hypothetical protein
MNDPTENLRRAEVAELNGAVKSDEPDTERQRLEQAHGKVWDTQEMQKEFTALGFMAPYIVVERIADGVKGSLKFQHSPRFYFEWHPD